MCLWMSWKNKKCTSKNSWLCSQIYLWQKDENKRAVKQLSIFRVDRRVPLPALCCCRSNDINISMIYQYDCQYINNISLWLFHPSASTSIQQSHAHSHTSYKYDHLNLSSTKMGATINLESWYASNMINMKLEIKQNVNQLSNRENINL